MLNPLPTHHHHRSIEKTCFFVTPKIPTSVLWILSTLSSTDLLLFPCRKISQISTSILFPWRSLLGSGYLSVKMVADSSGVAVRCLHMYYAENDDRPQKNQHGSLTKLRQCTSMGYSMLFATLFLFFFVGAGVAMVSFAESSLFTSRFGPSFSTGAENRRRH